MMTTLDRAPANQTTRLVSRSAPPEACAGLLQRWPTQWRPISSAGLLLASCLGLAGCAPPGVVEQTAASGEPGLVPSAVRLSDAYPLPLRVWPSRLQVADSVPDIVVIGLHGFNDYGNAFAPLAEGLSQHGILTYAPDQRGFGAAALPGRWHGAERLAEDLVELTDLLRRRHPDARLYLVGESMGGAVIISALARGPLPIDGVVLIAPAVWSRDSMPWYQRVGLDTLVRIAPGMRLSGRGLDIRPSDNTAMLRAMGSDPLVVKETRVDALWGVTNLMDDAMDAVGRLHGPVLVLYGERDDIIPRYAFCRMLTRLQSDPETLRLVLYRRGWHMLPRDLQGRRVRSDIAAWLRSPDAPLPSAEEAAADSVRLRAFCRTDDGAH